MLWNNEQIANKRDMLNMTLPTFERLLRKHGELETQLSTEADMFYLGSCLAVSAGKSLLLD